MQKARCLLGGEAASNSTFLSLEFEVSFPIMKLLTSSVASQYRDASSLSDHLKARPVAIIYICVRGLECAISNI